jgi:hypothetical protein
MSISEWKAEVLEILAEFGFDAAQPSGPSISFADYYNPRFVHPDFEERPANS